MENKCQIDILFIVCILEEEKPQIGITAGEVTNEIN